MLLAYKYRLYPKRSQAIAMAEMLETHRRLYNDALAERKTAYESEHRSVSYGEQSEQLKAARKANPYLAQTNFSSCQATLRRLNKAFQSFFRRVKAGEKPGYPRFKAKERFNTVGFPSHGDGCKWHGTSVYFQHIGDARVVLHRPVVGRIKTLSFTRRRDKWYVIVVCERPDPPVAADVVPNALAEVIGVDVGLESFATLSTGEKIANPRFLRRDEQALASAQRKLSKLPKGSLPRSKARKVVARIHERIANRRADFAHKVSRDLVNRFGLIVFEDLNIRNMQANHCLAKSIGDAAWHQLVTYTTYKAESAGGRMVTVDPRGTSQRCSACGQIVQKSLSVREHHCACGCVLDRDHNAALNTLRVALGRESLCPRGQEAAAL